MSAGVNKFALYPGRLVALLLLWGVFSMKFPLLLGAGLGLGLVGVGYYVVSTGRLDRVGGLVFANYGLWLASGLATGAIDGAMLSDPSYFTGEGRVFINYLPLLIALCYPVSSGRLRMLVKHLVYIAYAGLALYLIWAIARPSFLAGGAAMNFFGLLTSHTGSGTFFATLCVFLMSYGRVVRSRRHFLVGLSMLLPVLGSASREALVALLGVALWYMRHRISLRTVISTSVLVAAVIWIMPIIAPHTFDRTAQMLDMETVENVLATAANSNWEPGEDKDIEGGEYNILSRILYWVYATERFIESPVLGLGFGRFNDLNVHHWGVKGVFYFGVDAENNADTLHAHNSYIHMLCETGLAGLGLLLTLWYQLWRRIREGAETFKHVPELHGFFLGAQGLIVFVLIAALFGHALAAPTLGIPVLTTIGMAISYCREHKAR